MDLLEQNWAGKRTVTQVKRAVKVVIDLEIPGKGVLNTDHRLGFRTGLSHSSWKASEALSSYCRPHSSSISSYSKQMPPPHSCRPTGTHPLKASTTLRISTVSTLQRIPSKPSIAQQITGLQGHTHLY